MSPKVRSVLLSFFLNSRFRRLITDPEALLSPYVRPGQTVADIGCGPDFFTLALARLVGSNGRVIAADVDQYMLDKLVLSARRECLDGRIIAHRCDQGSLGLTIAVPKPIGLKLRRDSQPRLAVPWIILGSACSSPLAGRQNSGVSFSHA